MAIIIFPLLSGGIDSTIAILERLKNRDFTKMQPIFINYGQKAWKQEWIAVQKISEKIAELPNLDEKIFLNPQYIDLNCVSEDTKIFNWSKSQLITGKSDADPYLENRNMVLLSIGASFVESKILPGDTGIIITGFRNEWEDTQKDFVKSINEVFEFLFSEKKKTIRVETPIIKYGPKGKTKMVNTYQKYKYILDLTWSCYTPKITVESCRNCEACRNRTKAGL